MLSKKNGPVRMQEGSPVYSFSSSHPQPPHTDGLSTSSRPVLAQPSGDESFLSSSPQTQISLRMAAGPVPEVLPCGESIVLPRTSPASSACSAGAACFIVSGDRDFPIFTYSSSYHSREPANTPVCRSREFGMNVPTPLTSRKT
jgi:hypothetical protein